MLTTRRNRKVRRFVFRTDDRMSPFVVQASVEPNLMTEKDVDAFLVDLVKKHGLKTVQRLLKSSKYVRTLCADQCALSFVERKKIASTSMARNRRPRRRPNQTSRSASRSVNTSTRRNIRARPKPVLRNALAVGPSRHRRHRRKTVPSVTAIDEKRGPSFVFLCVQFQFSFS